MTEATYYERATEDVRGWYDEAGRSRRDGQLERAAETLQEIIRCEPGFAPAYNKLGVLEIARGHRDSAREWFVRALRFDEQYAPALTNLGNLALEQQDYETAQLYYDRALVADSEFGAAHQNLAIVLQHRSRYADAVRHLRAARRGHRRSVVPHSPPDSGASNQRRLLVYAAVAVGLVALLFLILRP